MALDIKSVGVGETSSRYDSDPNGYADSVAEIIREMSGGTVKGREVSMAERLDMDDACFAGIRYDAATNKVIVPIGPAAQGGFGEAVRAYWRRNTTDINIDNIIFKYRDRP